MSNYRISLIYSIAILFFICSCKQEGNKNPIEKEKSSNELFKTEVLNKNDSVKNFESNNSPIKYFNNWKVTIESQRVVNRNSWIENFNEDFNFTIVDVVHVPRSIESKAYDYDEYLTFELTNKGDVGFVRKSKEINEDLISKSNMIENYVKNYHYKFKRTKDKFGNSGYNFELYDYSDKNNVKTSYIKDSKGSLFFDYNSVNGDDLLLNDKFLITSSPKLSIAVNIDTKVGQRIINSRIGSVFKSNNSKNKFYALSSSSAKRGGKFIGYTSINILDFSKNDKIYQGRLFDERDGSILSFDNYKNRQILDIVDGNKSIYVFHKSRDFTDKTYMLDVFSEEGKFVKSIEFKNVYSSYDNMIIYNSISKTIVVMVAQESKSKKVDYNFYCFESIPENDYRIKRIERL